MNTLRSSTSSHFLQELPAALARMFHSDEILIWNGEGEPELIAKYASDTKVKGWSQTLFRESRQTQMVTKGNKAIFNLEIELLGPKVVQFIFENRQSRFLEIIGEAISTFMELFSDVVNRTEARKGSIR